MDKEQALEHLEKTVIAADSWERDTSQRYAAIVTATAVCLEAQCTRKEMAPRLKRSSAGSVTRFIVLARAIKKAVKVGEKKYPNPIKALESGNTLRQVYLAVRDATRPKKVIQYMEPLAAAANKIATMTIRTGPSSSVKLVEDIAAWAGALTALVGCALAERVIPERERKRFNTVIKHAVEQGGAEVAA